jgi:hypothetical protein
MTRVGTQRHSKTHPKTINQSNCVTDTFCAVEGISVREGVDKIAGHYLWQRARGIFKQIFLETRRKVR